MKGALLTSMIAMLFSFGTAILIYDFSGNQTIRPDFGIPVQSQIKASTSTQSSNLMATTSTSTIKQASSTENLSTDTNTATKTVVIIEKKAVNNKPITTITKSEPPRPTPTTGALIVPTTIKKPISWGVFAGSNPTTIHDFETRVKENPDYLAYFIHWGNGEGALPAFLSDYAYKKDRTLVLFWEASDYKIGGTDQPDFAYSAILRGDWDNYFISFAKQLKKYEGPVILIPFSELNGNWTPWSGTKNGNTPELAVRAFQYVHGFFSDAPNVQIGWAVNSVSVPQTAENQIANYYPGDAYVDIVGVDGFNMDNPWLSFDEIFSDSLNTVSQYNKPVFIFSFGSAEGPQKADWLHDSLYTQIPRYPLLEGWIYFNQNKERNWLLWSDSETFSVFERYISE